MGLLWMLVQVGAAKQRGAGDGAAALFSMLDDLFIADLQFQPLDSLPGQSAESNRQHRGGQLKAFPRGWPPGYARIPKI